MNRLSLCLAAVFPLALLFANPVGAQDEPAPPVTPPPRLAPAPVAPEPEIINRERSVYVPYEDLEKVFEQDGRGVFLPYREFLDLWNQLNLEKKKDEDKPPADGVLASANYKATVEGDEDKVLAIDAVLQVESFKEKGWAVVPLIKAGLNIAEADTGEATIHLGANGYELILPRKGQYEIKLKLFAKVNRSSGRNSVAINLPRAGVSKFEADLPDQGWEFDIRPGAAYTSSNSEDGGTKLAFFFGETEHFDISWQKQGEETKLTPLLFVDSVLNSRVVPGALQTDAVLNYRILRSGVNSFEISVPNGQEILSVAGENIKDWDVTDSDGSQRLLVNLHSSAKQAYSLKVSLEEALDALPTEFDVPKIVAENVVRQRGSVSLQTSGELEVETVSSDGLTQQSLAGAAPNAAPAVAGEDQLRNYGKFRFLTMPFSMTLSARKAEPVIEVESWTRFQVEQDSSNFTTRFDYDVKRVGIFETRIGIPDSFEGIDVIGPNVEDFSEEAGDDGAKVLVVKFRSRSKGVFNFEVKGNRNRASEIEEAIVPVFSPEGVDRHEGKVGVQLHSSLDPTTDVRDLRQQDVGLLGASKQGGQGIPGGNPNLQIGFRYRGEAEAATINFKLKKPQVTGEVFTLVEVREQLIHYEWTIAYNVLYAGVDTFVISLPESIAENLRHDGTLIKEVLKPYTAPEGTENPPVAEEGHVLWGIVLRDKKMGTYQLKLTLDEPLNSNALDEGNTEGARDFEVKLPEIKLEQVTTETGQVAVVKDDNLEILDAEPVSLESIDPKELKGGLARPGVFLSYKYRRHPMGLDLKVSRNEFLPVPQAVVTYADLTTVVSSDEAITTEVRYWVKNNAKQFFSVSLPEGGKMVSDIYVNGQPQQPMRRADQDVVLIRLPVGQNANTVFPVRFVYEVPSPNPGKKLGFSGSVVIDPIELMDAEILQSHLSLYLPRDYVYRSFKGAMRLPVRERGWTRFRNAFDWMIPALGPQLPLTREQEWTQPPTLPANQQRGFDIQIPKEGMMYELHRLDSPSNVKVGFQSKTFANFLEALLGIAAFVIGIFLLWRTLRQRLIYFVVAGLLPLVIAGAVSPNAASVWRAICLGVFFAAIIWVIVWGYRIGKRVGGRVMRWNEKRKAAKAARVVEPKKSARIKPPQDKADDENQEGDDQ